VATDRGDLKASTVVLAAGSWSSQLLDTVTSQSGTPIGSYRFEGRWSRLRCPIRHYDVIDHCGARTLFHAVTAG
jgi:glycine/D-amino acid oxidase-like deaminating enzyme